MNTDTNTTKIKAVFLPGKMADKRMWTFHMTELSHLIEPVFVDLSSQKTLDEMFTSILNSVNNEPFILIGFSMGGYVAQEFVIKHPSLVKGLVLIATSAQGYTPQEIEFQQKLVEVAGTQAFNGLTDLSLRNLLHPNHFHDFGIVNCLKEMANEIGREGFVNQLSATLHRIPRYKELSTIDCPALIICSEDDKIVPKEQMQFLQESMMNADLKVIANCGHIVPLEEPHVLLTHLKHYIEKWTKA